MDGQPFHDGNEELNQQGVENSNVHLKDLGKIALSSNSESEINQVESKRKKAKDFLRRHGRILSLFARDSSLSFNFSETDETFSFDGKKFEVTIPVNWFADEKFTDAELDFANRHELAHFIDMRRNPEAYLKNFEQMRKDAEKLAKDYVQRHPGEIPLERATKIFYKHLHILYNVLDDIYVNSVVFSRSPYFKDGDGRASVESLYKKLGFEKADLTKQPLHLQMVDSLLRDKILGDTCGKSIIDEKVENVLSGRKEMGKTIREWVDGFKPQAGGELIDPAKRHLIIREIIQPRYIELLEISLDESIKKDTEEEKEDKMQETADERDNSSGGSGEMQHSDGGGKDRPSDSVDSRESDVNFDPFDDKDNPYLKDILDHGKNDEDTIKKILEGMKEKERISKLPENKRAEEEAKKRQERFDEEYNISKDERREDTKIQQSIASARKEMRRFWDSLIGKSVVYDQIIIRNQKKGELDFESIIDNWPDLKKAEERGDLSGLEIYSRKSFERKIIEQPEAIDITLLVDCSGSMGSGGKIEATRATAALLMYSIKDFNEKLRLARKSGVTRSRLHANTEMIVFGSEFDTKKTFDKSHTKTANDVEIIKATSAINSERGGTNDAAPLADIESRLTTEEKKRLKNGKLKKIVFVITDGASQTPTETAQLINDLANEGVLVIGFQIGTVSSYEREQFEEIWNSDKSHPNITGIYIGKDVSDLPRRLMGALSDSLSNIRI